VHGRSRISLAGLVALIALAAPAASTASPVFTPPAPLDEPLRADVDRDGVTEEIRFRETSCFGEDGDSAPPCPEDGLREGYVELVDECAEGTVRTRLTGTGENVSLARLVDIDGDGDRLELAVELRSGATGRGVDARVLRFAAGEGDCARRKTVFAFPRQSTRGRAPRGAAFQTGSMTTGGFGATTKSRLRVLSTYVRPSDGQCCPTYARTSIWTYSPSRDRFTRISTRVDRLP
ncbi:MAG TPA: hypothetical protein VGV36_00370, partial [Solirubrobacteraceae bacterium]|nr:hypothetical protein [Solirubrobacteraceae bacterium]